MQIADLKPNPRNPRTITDQKLEMLKKSLSEFGDLGGFVYNRKTDQLVGGHQRAKIFHKSSKLVVDKKYSKPTKTGTVAEGYVEFEGERFRYREVEWDEIKEKAANIAANKGAGEWDLPELSNWLKEIDEFGFDLDLTMFDEGERLRAMAEVTKTAPPDEKEDLLPKLKKVAKSKLGEIYQLGQHRLLCGDSTKLEDYERLFGKEKVDITFTSPPYNGGAAKQMTKDGAKDFYENYSDDLPSDQYVRFASEVLANCIAYSRDYVFWNVNYNSNSRSEFIKQIVPHLDLLDETIAWKKNALPCPYGLTRVWEPIFVFKCNDEIKRICQLETHDTEFNVWDISNNGALHEEHRAAFPVALPERALALVKKAKSIFDPFGGSGTTMIAAEKLNKKCLMIELDPIYVDLIITRWEEYSGKKAKLLSKA